MLDLKFYLALFWRRLPYFLILLLIGTAAGITVARILPPVYQAEARLVVESEQIPDELAGTTVTTETSEQLQIIQQRILTRETLLDMARSQRIYQGAGRPDAPMNPDEIVRDMRSRISIRTTGGNVRRGQTQATIVNVSFTAPTGVMAANVANEVVTLLLAENVEIRTSVSGETLEFFSQQVDQLEQQLSQLSGEILQFQEANQEALPDSLDFRRSQQAAAQERLLEMERQENLIRDRRDQLLSLSAVATDATPLEAPQTPEERQLRELEGDLAGSVAIFSLDNPRLAVLRARIAALQIIVEEQRAARSVIQGGDGTTPLSAYELQVADLEGQLAFLAEQKVQINVQLAELESSIAATPANALTLERLERNFANLRQQYDQAVRKKAQAETGDVIESLSKGQRISVIEQASAPSEPLSPDRPKIAAAGVAAGVVMGFGFIILLELLNSALRRPADLRKALDIEPFMTLPYMRTKAQIWRRRMIVLAGSAVALIGLPAALWYVDQNVQSLQPYLDPILSRIGLT